MLPSRTGRKAASSSQSDGGASQTPCFSSGSSQGPTPTASMEKEGKVLTDVIGLHPYSDRENFALIQEQMTEHSDLVETRMKKEKKEREEKGQTGFSEEQRRQEEYCLLAELARIEQELREKSRKELERQEALERARSEANRDRWRNLSYMALSQRVNKPWVFSYFKNIPMHIYCQPIRRPPQVRHRKKWR